MTKKRLKLRKIPRSKLYSRKNVLDTPNGISDE